MPRLFLTRRFQKSFERFDKRTQERIKEAVDKIREDPLIGKRLTGDLSGDFSFRVGDYRIIYMIESYAIFLEAFRHRKDIYKKQTKQPARMSQFHLMPPL